MTVYRPDLVDADPAEVSHWLLEHGIGEVATAPAEGALAIDSNSNTDAEVEAALVGFTPTAPAGEFIYIPPEFRPHIDHLKTYGLAQRDGTMDAWTGAEWRTNTGHALADVIDLLRRNHQELEEEQPMGDKRTAAEESAAETARLAREGQAEAQERRDDAADQADLPDATATPDTDVSTEAEALEEGAPTSSGAIDTEPEPAPPADTDATRVESAEGRGE